MADRSGRRNAVLLAALTGVALILGSGTAPVSARPTIVLEQSAATDAADAEHTGSSGPVHGAFASVSGDGRYYVYQGMPTGELVQSGADSRTATIFLTDRETGLTTELSSVPAGLRQGDSVRPVISGDGCTAVMVTELALDVFRDDDTGERWDVYRARLPHCGGILGGWELVSTRTDGSTLARDDVTSDQTPAVSRSGTLVAYTHPADHLLDTDDLTTISLVDLTVPVDAPRRSTLVAGAPIITPDTTFVHRGLDQPALSGDGRFLAYRSDAASNEAVPGWGTGEVPGGPATRQIFAWDREQADPFVAVALISARADGSPSAADASDPVLSRDGRVVAFTSNDVGLVPAVFPVCPETCPTQVFRVDRDVDGNGWFDERGRTAITMVSAQEGTSPPLAGVAPSGGPALNADGQLVAFVTKASNLQLVEASGGGDATDGDVLVADTASGRLRRVTISPDGVRPVIGAHARPRLNDTGRTVVFDTLAARELLGGEPPTGRSVVALSSFPSLSLADADLGTTLVGFESDEWYVAVINNGTSSFVPSKVTVSDRRFRVNEEASTCSLAASVPPGGDCTVRLTFTPSSPGPVSATLTVSEAGFQAASVSSRVSGAGGEPALRIDPAGADLGRVEIGTSSSEFLFDVRNISLVPTSIRAITVEGAHVGDFAIASNNCANRPLNPRATCSVGVMFTPTAAGRRTAVVRISTPFGQYSTMVVAGDAVYAPTLELMVDEVTAGQNMVVSGRGYPPDSDVTIVFGDGGVRPVRVRTNLFGELLAVVPVSLSDHGGSRTVVVHAPQGAVVSAPVTVVPSVDTTPGMPGFGLGG